MACIVSGRCWVDWAEVISNEALLPHLCQTTLMCGSKHHRWQIVIILQKKRDS